jgi:hypothetical protein
VSEGFGSQSLLRVVGKYSDRFLEFGEKIIFYVHFGLGRTKKIEGGYRQRNRYGIWKEYLYGITSIKVYN